MSVLVVGVSHNSAPVSLLEQVALEAEAVPKLIQSVAACEHVTEATVIATCNRVEIYADVDRFHGSVEELSRLLIEPSGRSTDAMLPHLYVHYDDGAVSHLFQVAAGLDSMAVGEGQILGQTREALRLGQELGTVGPALNVLFQQALRVGKRSRAETDIDSAAPTLVGAALDRSARHGGDVAGRRVAVVGAGAMAGLATATVSRRGAAEVVVVNRTRERAERLAEEYAGRAASLGELAAVLAEADVVIACTGSTGLLVTRADVEQARCDGRSMVFLDLALPHDVDPTIVELDGVTRVDLGDLAQELEDSDAGREVAEVRRHRHRGGRGLRRRAPLRERDADRGRAPVDGHLGGRRRDGAARPPAARPEPRGARRGAARRTPGRGQAAPRADRAGQGAGQRDRCGLLRRRARRAVRAGPRGRRRRHPSGGPRMITPVRIGTRASLLATTQSELVAAMVRDRLGRETELVEVTTDGDRSQSAQTPIEQAGGTGIFVSALRDALLAGEVDVAVHSLKDLPTAAADGIALAAVPPREDPRDVVVARDGLTLGELPAGSRVGTGSPRRVAQLLALGLGLDVVGVRGNVDTRITKVHSGEYDAVILARAGLARIDRLEEVTEVLDPLQMLPAPGQGALAVECRADDDLLTDLAALDDRVSRVTVEAERAVLATLEGGCSAPIGAMAEVAEGEDGEELWVRAVALSTDGALSVRMSATGDPNDAAGVGSRLAKEMLADGAGDLETAGPEADKVHDA